jgi:cell wall assembly regulator SMI1
VRIAETWKRIETRLRASGPAFSLPVGATEDLIAACERRLGLELPPDYRASVAIHDGTERYLFDSCELGSLESVIELWHVFAELTSEPGPIPASEWMRVTGPIRAQFWNPRWVPIGRTTSADTILMDLDPPAGGLAGQVIHLTHEMSELHFVAPSFQAWIETFADDLDAGRYEIRVSNGDVMGLEKRP